MRSQEAALQKKKDHGGRVSTPFLSSFKKALSICPDCLDRHMAGIGKGMMAKYP